MPDVYVAELLDLLPLIDAEKTLLSVPVLCSNGFSVLKIYLSQSVCGDVMSKVTQSETRKMRPAVVRVPVIL